MATQLTLDKAGRIVLPKPIRDELRLEPGDTLELETSGDKITLRPARGHAQLRKKRGIWVYRSGEPLRQASVENAIQEVREERDKHAFGERR
jgi:AbrB family looped-hinge helix DNA binding protein